MKRDEWEDTPTTKHVASAFNSLHLLSKELKWNLSCRSRDRSSGMPHTVPQRIRNLWWQHHHRNNRSTPSPFYLPKCDHGCMFTSWPFQRSFQVIISLRVLDRGIRATVIHTLLQIRFPFFRNKYMICYISLWTDLCEGLVIFEVGTSKGSHGLEKLLAVWKRGSLWEIVGKYFSSQSISGY